MTTAITTHRYPGLERATRADEPTLARLFEGIARRGELSTAAAHANLSYETVHRWRQISPAFDDAVTQALAGHGGKLIDMVWGVMDDPDLKPGEKLNQLRWFLEKLHPGSFGARQTVTVETLNDDKDTQAFYRVCDQPSAAAARILDELGYTRHGKRLVVETEGTEE